MPNDFFSLSKYGMLSLVLKLSSTLFYGSSSSMLVCLLKAKFCLEMDGLGGSLNIYGL